MKLMKHPVVQQILQEQREKLRVQFNEIGGLLAALDRELGQRPEKPAGATMILPGPTSRRPKSAAERKVISKRMKAYWAARRKAKLG